MTSWNALIPVIATFSCLQVAVAFALLFAKVSRRQADLLFSALALCLAGLVWSAFLFGRRETLEAGLLWLRMQYAAAFAAMTVFFHFGSVVVGVPLRPLLLGILYPAGAILAGLVFTPLFLDLPPADTALAHMVPAARGPAYAILAPLVVLGPLVGWLQVMRGFRRRRQDGLAPLAHLPLILGGGLLIILAGAVIVAAVLFFENVRLPINLQSLAVMVFCGLIGWALGVEILRSERERQRLAQLARFRQQAVRDVAHELKNPLAAIQTSMATAREALRRGVEIRATEELLGLAIETCGRLTRLINNMLDTARLEAGRDPVLRIEDTHLARLVEEVLAAQSLVSAAHRLQCRCELEQPVLPVDPDKVHQILANLVHNAIKYSPQGGEVTVRLWREPRQVCVSVSDQGIGMTPEQQERLFQPFERAADIDRKITGTGIGLHLVKRLVETHGGRIWAESVHGHGSTFTLALPCER